MRKLTTIVARQFSTITHLRGSTIIYMQDQDLLRAMMLN